MGVTGLWTVVQPCARPIKIETLNRKRLAVDASIWIYQFLKAVRDKEGNALRNSHVVGFFRRICKLLFVGIRPVFVFDGGAPALKRQTVVGRRARREGRREDAARTAGKLLALQMHRRAQQDAERAEDEARRRRRQGDLLPAQREEEEVPDNPVYVDELAMTQRERDQNRRFRKTDQYHLPDLRASLSEMGRADDPRVMSLEELEDYARQFDAGEDVNLYDFSKIDFDGPFFRSLPTADRYNILNAARLRSRLRMGYSKDQLEGMFPDRMAFSRFQVERVKERNELTQRLMHLTGMSTDGLPGVGTGRIAGDRGREYVLVKNAGVEGGWALGVIGGDKDAGERSKPIDVDRLDEKPKVEEENSDEDMGFEDVPIEGLNRLPKVPLTSPYPTSKISTADILRRRQEVYQSRSGAVNRKPAPSRNPPRPPATTSYKAQEASVEDADSLFVEPLAAPDADTGGGDEEEDAELRKAIAMSLEKDDADAKDEVTPGEEDDDDDDEGDFEEVFQVRRQEPVAPFKNTRGRVADIANKASVTAAAVNKKAGPFDMEGDDSDDENVPGTNGDKSVLPAETAPFNASSHANSPDKKPANHPLAAAKFDGPLPFEKLDLGSSILGKKKMQKLEESRAGGFEKEADGAKRSAAPIPPWFNEDVEKSMQAQKASEAEDRARERKARDDEKEDFVFDAQPSIGSHIARDVVDIDALEDRPARNENSIITIESESEDEPGQMQSSRPAAVDDTKVQMDDLADLTRADPPSAITESRAIPDTHDPRATAPPTETRASSEQRPEQPGEDEEEEIEWEASDHEQAQAQAAAKAPVRPDAVPAGGALQPVASRSPSLEFEDVDLTTRHGPKPFAPPPLPVEESTLPPIEDSGPLQIAADSDEEQFFSSDEDEELMYQLANEAEEHARFASQLAKMKNSNTSSSVRQSIEEYEQELKSLRSQQKKDRRDADEVTQVMITECQQLLRLFGLPYITAPMEAEAQCAELVHLGLVDGIVTDDSDIFLFGGTRIYKNMFNQAKFVECYLASDLEREFDLTREKMIRLAHLLGSDYTEGLPGIGPVTALEVISEFDGGLADFRDWWTRVQRGASTVEEDGGSAFRRKFRRNVTKLFLPTAFPDLRVDEAYLKPDVDSDPSVFQWGVPDLDALRSFLMATIGWSQERTDEVLVPVVRDMNRRAGEGTQANMTSFLGGGGGGGAVGAGAFAPRRRDVGKSKRMESALERLAAKAKAKKLQARAGPAPGEDGRETTRRDGDADPATDSAPKSKAPNTTKSKRAAVRRVPSVDGHDDDGVDHDESDDGEEAPPSRKRRRKAPRPAKRKKAEGHAIDVDG